MSSMFDLSCQFGQSTRNIRLLELHLVRILFGAFTLNLSTGWYCRSFTVSYIFTNATEEIWILKKCSAKQKWRKKYIIYIMKQNLAIKSMINAP